MVQTIRAKKRCWLLRLCCCPWRCCKWRFCRRCCCCWSWHSCCCRCCRRRSTKVSGGDPLNDDDDDGGGADAVRPFEAAQKPPLLAEWQTRGEPASAAHMLLFESLGLQRPDVAALRAAFDAIDADGSGDLSLGELLGFFDLPRGSRFNRRVFAVMDEDRSGSVRLLARYYSLCTSAFSYFYLLAHSIRYSLTCCNAPPPSHPHHTPITPPSPTGGLPRVRHRALELLHARPSRTHALRVRPVRCGRVWLARGGGDAHAAARRVRRGGVRDVAVRRQDRREAGAARIPPRRRIGDECGGVLALREAPPGHAVPGVRVPAHAAAARAGRGLLGEAGEPPCDDRRRQAGGYHRVYPGADGRGGLQRAVRRAVFARRAEGRGAGQGGGCGGGGGGSGGPGGRGGGGRGGGGGGGSGGLGRHGRGGGRAGEARPRAGGGGHAGEAAPVQGGPRAQGGGDEGRHRGGGGRGGGGASTRGCDARQAAGGAAGGGGVP